MSNSGTGDTARRAWRETTPTALGRDRPTPSRSDVRRGIPDPPRQRSRPGGDETARLSQRSASAGERGPRKGRRPGNAAILAFVEQRTE